MKGSKWLLQTLFPPLMKVALHMPVSWSFKLMECSAANGFVRVILAILAN